MYVSVLSELSALERMQFYVDTNPRCEFDECLDVAAMRTSSEACKNSPESSHNSM